MDPPALSFHAGYIGRVVATRVSVRATRCPPRNDARRPEQRLAGPEPHLVDAFEQLTLFGRVATGGEFGARSQKKVIALVPAARKERKPLAAVEYENDRESRHNLSQSPARWLAELHRRFFCSQLRQVWRSHRSRFASTAAEENLRESIASPVGFRAREAAAAPAIGSLPRSARRAMKFACRGVRAGVEKECQA